MTAPKSIADYGDMQTRVYAVYGPDHPDETKRGQLITRERICPAGKEWGCQNSIKQIGVSRDWLAKLSVAHRTGFLENCELDSNGSAWLPRGCARCMRAT